MTGGSPTTGVPNQSGHLGHPGHTALSHHFCCPPRSEQLKVQPLGGLYSAGAAAFTLTTLDLQRRGFDEVAPLSTFLFAPLLFCLGLCHGTPGDGRSWAQTVLVLLRAAVLSHDTGQVDLRALFGLQAQPDHMNLPTPSSCILASSGREAPERTIEKLSHKTQVAFFQDHLGLGMEEVERLCKLIEPADELSSRSFLL